MIYFNPCNPEIEKIFNRLIQYPGVTIDRNIARNISRYKTIRLLREKNNIYIARDTNKNKTLLFFPPNVKIEKYKNGFKFEIF